ncbi:MAG TPA: FAD-dependent oxidoreductase [Hyphomicrobiaceae bacterium]|nr:FAD-dependent oxidoreductase [Hyphomicrobiaceae bacterium]
MSHAAPFPHLFSPLEVGGRTLRNRIALSATLTNYAAGHRITERWIDFLAERAKGGCGAIVTEVIAVDPAALAHGAIVTGYDKANEEGFKRTAEAVEGAGACLIGQLWHPGRQQLWSPVWTPKGISDQPDAYSWTVPHVMTGDELRNVAEAYVAVARRLERCGFGGVELHGAHGYLISQILSPWSNRRTDRYGGSLENRVRFIAEVGAAIRSACRNGFIVGLKMPGDEGVAGGIDPDESARITAALAAHGVLDYFAYSQGNFTNSLENHVPDMHFRRAPFLDIHRRLRPAAAGTPVMAIGRIAMPAEAEGAIAEGAGDLVGLTRALIADADWPNKAREGRTGAIRPSSYDNFSWGEIHQGKPLAEIHNPQLGTRGESDWRPARAGVPKRVVVVGAGPAGLQAARVAAQRGHDVTLMGASPQLGGKLRWEAQLPGREEYANVLAWMQRQLGDTDARTTLGRPATIQSIRELDPDAVILATGATLRPPEAVEGGLSVRAWNGYLHNHRCDGTAVLFDMDHSAATYAVADALAARYGRLVLLTPRTQIARNVNYCSAIGIHRRLYQAEAEIVVAAEPVAFQNGTLRWRNVFTGRERLIGDVALFLWSTPRLANDALAQPLRQSGVDVHLVGDCAAPRNLLCAIHEGEAAATAI